MRIATGSVFVSLLLVTQGIANADERLVPFANEVRALSNQQPARAVLQHDVRRPGFSQSPARPDAVQRDKMHSEAIRQGPVMPPLIDFINEIDNGLSLPAAAPEASWILRAYNPRLQLPGADIMPRLNMRQPTPF